MNTIPRRLRHFGAPLLIMLLAATLGWFVQAIGVVAVVFIVVLVKRFGKFESQLAATTFTVVSAFFALAPHSQFKIGGGLLETALCIACVWTAIAIASNRDSDEEAIRRNEKELREAMHTIPAMVSEDRERTLENQTRSTEEMETMDHLYRLRGADGAYRWFRTIAEPCPSADGKSHCWYGVATDIDELYRSRELLRERELQLNFLTENLPAVLFKAAPDGSIIYINQKGIEYSGRTVEDLKGWIDLVHPDDVEETKNHWNRMLSENLGYDTVNRFIGADGQYRWFHTSVAPYRDDAGKTLAFHGIMLDTTAQKAAELALQQSEQQMQRMMDTFPSLLWSMAPDGSNTFINRKARDYLGMTLDQIQDWGWIQVIHPGERGYVVQELKKALASGSSYEAEHRIRRADGLYRWQMGRAEPLRDEGGLIVQWFGVVIDIDERKRAEDHLRETRVKLERTSRIATVAELSASITHELNQPLTAVIANAQAARRWLSNSPSKISEAMTSIERVLRDGRVAAERMQHIRALFKQQPLRKKHAWPSQIIREAIRFVHEGAKRDEIPIDVQIAGDPPILVEKIQIQEVLINLISNGIEAMESNARPPHLIVGATLVNESELLIEVIDNGPGLKDTQSIFEAFVTTKENGMGIGLAVSRSIIEAHDGQLWAENNPDYGAKFSVKLPCGAQRVPRLES